MPNFVINNTLYLITYRLMKRPHLITILLIFIFCLQSHGQTSYRFINVENGLSDNSILDMECDNFGYLWIATNEGLNIISGDKVRKLFKSEGDIRLPGNEMNCLLNDAERETMWIGTQRDGIVGFNYVSGDNRFFNKKSDPGYNLSGNAITSICFDRNRNLLVGTFYSGINHIDVEKGNVSHFNKSTLSGLESDKIWSIDYDSAKDVIYAGHEDGGFSEISIADKTARTYTKEDGLPDNTVRKVLSDGNYVWVCTDKGLCRFNKTTKEFLRFAAERFSGRCLDAIKTEHGILLAYEDHGTILLDTISGEFIHVGADRQADTADATPNIIRISEPNCLLVDQFDNILIGTNDHGLIAVSNNNNYFTSNILPQENQYSGLNSETANVISIVSLMNGDVWIATENKGIYSSNPKYSHKRLMQNSRILDMVGDNDNSLWICDRNGVLTNFIPTTGKSESYNTGIEDYDWIGMDVIGDSIWISSNSGVLVFDKNRRKVAGHHDVENNLVRKIAKDSKGNIYVGTFGQGLSMFDKNMRPILSYKKEDGFPSNTVNDILEDGEYIWIATGEGIVKLTADNPDNYEVLSKPSRAVCALIKDNKNNVWFSTIAGIGVVLKGDSVVMFNSELPIRNFNAKSASCDATGRVYFGSSRGILTFMPEYVLDKKNFIQPLISELIIDNGHKDGTDVIATTGKEVVVLDHSQNNFTVIISSLDIFRPGDTYEYRMMGLDDKWYPIGEERRVSFKQLPYGKYTFEIRNSKESDSEKYSSIKIEILPPVWLRWWAKLIYAILAIAAGCVIFAWYRNRLRHRAMLTVEEERLNNQRTMHEERVRFFTNVTHELRTPLTLINGPLEDLLKGDTLVKEDRWKVDVIHKNAQRLLSLVNQLLDYRKTETNNKRLCVDYGDIVSAVKEIAIKYVELNRNPNVNISVSSSTGEIQTYFDKEILTMVLDNLISNAMKYTESGMITISVAPEQRGDEKWIKISVKDTGHGISNEALPYIFDRYYQEKSQHQASGTGIGLALVKALVELHEGEITVESAKGVGSCFNIYLHRDRDYPEAIHIDSHENPGAPESMESSGAGDVRSEKEVKDPILVSPDSIDVLVVEDNPDILEYIRQSLSGIFNVKTAANGRDGLEIARRDIPDIIVTDVMMPVMDGMEMTAHLKNDVKTSHIPIVMLTAKDTSADRQEGYNVGVDSYITKPFNASLLIARINNILSRRNMLTEYLRNHTITEKKSEKKEDSKDEKGILADALGKLDREFIEKLDHAILDCDNPEKVNLDYLTDVMCMSRPTLYRKMKAVTGMSGNEYIRHIRMVRAKELLLSGEYSMSEIADRLGFSSANYFRETFKTVFGKTPSDYLKSLKQS